MNSSGSGESSGNGFSYQGYDAQPNTNQLHPENPAANSSSMNQYGMVNNSVNQVNMSSRNNQSSSMNAGNQRLSGSSVTPGMNQAYLRSLLLKIQPDPGMTKKQRFEQLLRSGELTQMDIDILQRHQQMIRQAQATRQRQREQQVLNDPHNRAQVASKSLPGKSLPGKSLPGKSLPGKSLPGKSLSGKSLPGKSVPGKSLPGKSVLDSNTEQLTYHSPNNHQTLAGKSVPAGMGLPHPSVNAMSDFSVNSPTNSMVSPMRNMQSPMGQAVNQYQVSPSVNQSVNQPVNQAVNQPPVNQPVNRAINQPVNNQAVNTPTSTTFSNQSFSQPVNSSDNAKSQQSQQEQLKLLQQKQQQQRFFGLTPDQFEKLTPQQKHVLKLQQLRRKAKTQRFYESDEEILKKYEKNQPSLDFHIHNDHYRFGNRDALVPKNDPAIKDFLKFVAQKKIPDALMEIIKDGNIPLYEGNLILRIYDHRVVENSKSLSLQVKNENTENGENSQTGEDSTKQEPLQPEKTSKEYRTVLRLTQSALYEDFCQITDTQLFSDGVALTYESEILSATIRSINLNPIHNPYLEGKSLWPIDEMVRPHYNEETNEMIFPHRSDVRELPIDSMKKPISGGKKLNPLTCENYEYKPLHQDESQSNSKYEKLMMILSDKMVHSNVSISKPTIELPRFERLRFIEQLRKNNANKLLQRNSLQGQGQGQGKNQQSFSEFRSLMSGGNDTGSSFSGFSNRSVSANPEQSSNNTNNMANVKAEDADAENSAAKGKGAKAASKKRAAPKKPKKLTKKQLAAQEAAANGLPVDSEPPKKKRAPTKKKAALSANATG